LQKALVSLADFLMGQKLTAAERCITAFDGRDDAGLFVEMLHENVLYQFVRVATLSRSRLRQFGFEVWLGDVNIHGVCA
jgi:hypothetical protein